MWKYLLLVVLLQNCAGKNFFSEYCNKNDISYLNSILDYLLLPIKLVQKPLSYEHRMAKDSIESPDLNPPDTPVQDFEASFRFDSDEEEDTDFDPTEHPKWKLVNPPICGEGSHNRIIGGQVAALGQYPWIAKIGYRMKNTKIKYKCGAALISSLYVVTAAHCVSDLPKTFKVDNVKLGEYNMASAIDCEDHVCADKPQIFKIAEIIKHKNFNKPKQSNDIALIRLDRRVKFTQWIRPICLPHGPLMHKDYVGSMMEVAGWGLTDLMTWKTSNVLLTVKVPVRNISVCVKGYRSYTIFKEKQMCVGGQVGKDSCRGDSGGPLMKVDKITSSPKYYLFGIVSFGPNKCGATSYPGVYTNVRAYMEWILDNIY